MRMTPLKQHRVRALAVAKVAFPVETSCRPSNFLNLSPPFPFFPDEVPKSSGHTRGFRKPPSLSTLASKICPFYHTLNCRALLPFRAGCEEFLLRYRSLGRRPHTWDYQIQAFCRYKGLGPWLEEAKCYHHWTALFEDFYAFSQM